MLTISKPLSSGQAQTYHTMEFTAESQNYYRQGGGVEGEWQGQLAERFGLSGTAVGAREFSLLTEGKDPRTDEQLVRHREAMEYKNQDGTIIKAVEHRAGWDATFSAPKSVSLTALVGGDHNVREAHRAAVTTALAELERYTQARLGGNKPGETTGKFLVAKFEHDTARPVDGYAAPQLHTHAVIFNMTERDGGKMQALQPRSMFESQSFATAVYQSELTYRLQKLGYELTTGRSGAPEIKGYSQEYLDASSLRSQQIRERLEQSGFQGPAAAQIAAHATRDSKELLSPEAVLAAHRALASEFGNQADRVVRESQDRVLMRGMAPAEAQARANTANGQPWSEPGRKTAQELAKEAVGYAKEHIYEREAVADRRAILRDALRHGMGEVRLPEVLNEFDERRAQGEFRQAGNRIHDTDLRFTTPATLAAERANIAIMRAGQDAMKPMLTPKMGGEHAAGANTNLNPAQKRVVEEVLSSKDRIQGLQGLAGTGKTTTLETIRKGAELGGYTVEGFAPTSRAAASLREAGVSADTLQSFLARGDNKNGQETGAAGRHLYMLDESSFASTRQMRGFLEKIDPNDRVLVIGDIGQHQGVDAGRPFEQLQQAGMRTAQLDTIMRQRDPELLKVVEHLAKGEVKEGIGLLRQQDRVTEIRDAAERIRAIAKDYAAKPQGTIIVSPDNASRREINQAVREELRAQGMLPKEGKEFTTLVTRNDMTGADRAWAARYQPDDIIHYTKGSKTLGIERGSYATVTAVDAKANQLTVRRENGDSVTYDPTRLRGVTAYREVQGEFAVGDRVQFTAPNRQLAVANRDLGTVTAVESNAVTVRLESKDKRTVSFDPERMRHFDHGYAVTSHSSQGSTAGRVIVNIDTDAGRGLINTRLAYVSVSRAANDARIYTNHADNLAQRLQADVSKTVAVEYGEKATQAGPSIPPGPRRTPEIPALPVSRTAELRNAVAKLATDDARAGTNMLELQGRVLADPDRAQRMNAIARAFAVQPERTVAVASSPEERRELNRLIRAELQTTGVVAQDSRTMPVMVERTIDRGRAGDYAPGDWIHFRAGNAQRGIEPHTTAVVLKVEDERNRLTIQRQDGQITYYDPARLTATHRSLVYREETREIAVGDRIRITGHSKDDNLRAGDLGTVEAVRGIGALQVKMDSGHIAEMNPALAKHIDHGYAVESTHKVAADRLLISLEDHGRLAPGSPLAKNLHRASDAMFYVPDRFALYEPRTAEDVQKFMERAPAKQEQNPTAPDAPVIAQPQIQSPAKQQSRGLGI